MVSYGYVLVGLFISMYCLFKQEEHQKGLLVVEVMERERFEEAFREMSEENMAIAELGRIAISSLDIHEAFVLFLIQMHRQMHRLVKFDESKY